MKYKVITEFHKGDKTFKVGDVLELDKKSAERFEEERLVVEHVEEKKKKDKPDEE